MKVLIAVDETEHAKAIADFVIHHRWPAHSEFTILSVVQPTKVANIRAVLPGPILDTLWDENYQAATAVVRDTALAIREAFLTEHTIMEEIVEGIPREEIINYANNLHTDLVIVGSHGRSGLSRVILGSVSLAVVSQAPCSVVVVRVKSTTEQTPLANRTAQMSA